MAPKVKRVEVARGVVSLAGTKMPLWFYADYSERSFERTRNPFDAWREFLDWTEDKSLPIDGVLGYFADVATRLCEFKSSSTDAKNRVHDAVMLGPRSGQRSRTMAAKFDKRQHEGQLLHDLALILGNETTKQQSAIALVRERHLVKCRYCKALGVPSHSTVDRVLRNARARVK